ncbi:aminopeptidase P family protein [Candidatus Woesearchaeota archaeon]|nr:aminopeptidase P family protein [Candidatus Woesearchaeota archaeon]
MKALPKTDVCLFLKTEHTTENMIEYFTSIKIDIGILILFKRKKPMLFISSLEQIPKRNDIIIEHIDFEKIKSILHKEKTKIIGTHDLKLTKRGLELFKKSIPKGAKFKDITEDLEKIRSIKSEKEIQSLKKGIKITEEIIGLLIKNISNMTYEQEAIRFLKMECLKRDVKTSFEPLIATGPDASNPHYYPKKGSKLKKGFCIIDFGIVYDNLCTDISRTIFLGKPTEKEKDFYKLVLDGQLKVEKESKPNKKMTFPFKMVHALGHGIGIEVHEHPMLPNDAVKVNTCIAIEPGLYSKEMSVRIEDDFVMRKTGLKRLSTSSRELITINWKR